MSKKNSLPVFNFDIRKWEMLPSVKKYQGHKAINKLKLLRLEKD